MIRVSIGTAAHLGLCSIKSAAPPTTGYLMNTGGCTFHCAFCPQGQGDKENLSRITWPLYEEDLLLEHLKKDHKLKRLCLQVVHKENWQLTLKSLVPKLLGDLPLCVSCRPQTEEEIHSLFALGIEYLSIPLDACTEEVGMRINRPFQKHKEMLYGASALYPKRVNTHLMIGLGETEEESIKLMTTLYEKGIQVALFAFTPIKKTPLEHKKPPAISHYRRVQAARYLLHQGSTSFSFFKGKLQLTASQKKSLTEKAFQTSGCPDCNRPFYNERPGQTLYNYPWIPSKQEFLQALAEMEDME